MWNWIKNLNKIYETIFKKMRSIILLVNITDKLSTIQYVIFHYAEQTENSHKVNSTQVPLINSNQVSHNSNKPKLKSATTKTAAALNILDWKNIEWARRKSHYRNIVSTFIHFSIRWSALSIYMYTYISKRKCCAVLMIPT